MKLFIDLETLPTDEQWIKDEIRQSISPPANYKKPESIEAWMKANGESAYQDAFSKTSFDGSSGRICCIGFAIDNGPAIAFYGDSGCSEREKEIGLIQTFFDYMNKYCREIIHCGPEVAPVEWIGHNLTGFDLRFLYQRCVILGINTHGLRVPVDERHGKGRVFDTMIAWKGFGAKAGGSMERLCKVLDIPGKGDVSGADVWPMYQQGRIDEIAEYCKGDVERTRKIYKRLVL